MIRYKSASLLNRHIKAYDLEGVFDHIKDIVEYHEFETGEYILREASKQSFYYFLVEGKAKVCPSSTKGDRVLLDFMTPLDIIGDIEYLTHVDNIHDVLALKKTLMIAIPIQVLDAELKDNVCFYKLLSRIMARKIIKTSKKYSQAMMYPLRVRFAMYLLEHFEEGFHDEVIIKFQEIADYFGITSRHLRRIMLEYEDEGILERGRGRILIHDMARLRAAVKGVLNE